MRQAQNQFGSGLPGATGFLQELHQRPRGLQRANARDPFQRALEIRAGHPFDQRRQISGMTKA